MYICNKKITITDYKAYYPEETLGRNASVVQSVLLTNVPPPSFIY